MRRIHNCSFATIDLKDVTITLRDGTTPTPNELEVSIGEGNLTYTERRERKYTKDRGKLDDVRDGDEAPMDVSFDFKWDYLQGTGGTDITIEDVLKQRGGASAWKSTDSDQCRPFAVDLVLKNKPACATANSVETTVLPDFRHEEMSHDLRGGTVACTGKCNATEPTIVRSDT